MTFNKLQKAMFQAAGEDQQLRLDIAAFLLTYVRGSADEAAQYLQTKPEVNKLFAQVTSR